MRIRTAFTALVAVIVMSMLSIGGAMAATDRPTVTRLAGNNRYGTAVAVSQQFAPGPDYVFIAAGENFPDALAGAALAGSTDSPLLLVKKDGIWAHTVNELQRLRPKEIIVLGGTQVVSLNVENELAQYATSGTVTRLSGENRYGTANAISARYETGPDYAFIATGANFPDALAGTALAGKHDSPLILVPGDRIPAGTATELARLAPRKIVVLGGEQAVSATLDAQLAQYATADSADEVTRIAGSDRYSTSVAIAKKFTSPSSAYVATGEAFPDALTGGARAGGVDAPLLLTRRFTLPGGVDQQLTRLAPADVYVLGGTTAITSRVQSEIAHGAIKPVIRKKPIVSWNGEGARIAPSTTTSTTMRDNGSTFEVVKMLNGNNGRARFPAVVSGIGLPNADGRTPYSIKSSIPAPAGYARSEVINTYAADMYSQQAFGYSMFIPRNQKQPVGAQWSLFSQLKQTNCGVPPMAFHWTPNVPQSSSTMQFEIRLQNDKTGWRPTNPYRVIYRGSLPKGQWNRLAMTWTASPNNPRNAYFNLWINGKQVPVELPEGEAIGYTSACTDYPVPMSMNLRTGIYRGGYTWAEEGVTYYDNMKFGSTYQDVHY